MAKRLTEQQVNLVCAIAMGPMRIGSGGPEWRALSDLRDRGVVVRRNAWWQLTPKGEKLAASDNIRQAVA